MERHRKQARITQIEVKNCLQGFEKSKEIRESVIPLVEAMLDAKNVRIVDVNKDQNALQNVLRELEKRQKEKTVDSKTNLAILTGTTTVAVIVLAILSL